MSLSKKFFWRGLTFFCIGLASVSRMSQASLEVTDHSEIKADIFTESRYVYNVYYDYLRSISDELFAVKPVLSGHMKPSSFYLDGDLNGVYENYFSQTIQNHFDYDGTVHANINESQPQSFVVSGGYHSFSDPSPNETYGRLTHNQIESSLKFKSKGTKGEGLNASVRYFSEDFINPELSSQAGFVSANYLANRTIEGVVQYSKLFSPETTWLLRGTGGSTQYPNSTISAPVSGTLLSSAVQKDNSTYGLLEAGLVGRLGERSTIDFAAGYLYRSYTDSVTFLDPVFYAHFADQITRRDQLITGYNYTVKDSYWTDYYLDQEVYLGVAHVAGDQMILVSRIAFDYRSFSPPNKRNDERISGSVGMKYSLSSSIKLTADLKVDLLASDAFDTALQSSPQTNPNGSVLKFLDAPASYQAGSFGLGLVAEF